MQDIIRKINRKQMDDRAINYSPGDTISVHFRIKEGDKERIQQFQGVVIQTRGTGSTATVTVRKSSGNVYVERIFPIYSPLIAEVKVMKRGSVRRAKLYYLRGLTGKRTRIKEKK
jgi:large subunit ribosomal protein L19